MEKILVAEDDPDALFILETCLTEAGYEVLAAPDGKVAAELLRAHRPPVAVLDIMMPRMHGYNVLQRIREDPWLRNTHVIVLSAKAYPTDIQKAKDLGADDYIVKPYKLDDLLEKIRAALQTITSRFWVKFWGTRGLIPTPGRAKRRYGGNTSCVEVRCGERIVMLDCGSGALEMGQALRREFEELPVDVSIFVSHTRWDRVLGLPFFTPAYFPGSQLSVYTPAGADKMIEDLFRGQADTSFSAPSLGEIKGRLRVAEMKEPVQVGEAVVSRAPSSAVGQPLSFRVDFLGKSVVYVTDQGPGPEDSEHEQEKERSLAAFAQGADLYIREAQCTEEEYAARPGSGHSTPARAMQSAHGAKVKRLALFHHDPIHDDEFLDQMVAECRNQMQQRGMEFECFGASDGLRLML